MNLLSTIRVPKNLLYLTDRLPKPNYDSDEKARREKEELLRRRTYEGSSALLPDIQHSTGNSGGGSIQGSQDRSTKQSEKARVNSQIAKSKNLGPKQKRSEQSSY